MINTHYREKLINAIIYFAKNTKFCGTIKLMRPLYFLDFRHFKETGKSVTGLIYTAWENGPVPVSLYKEISSDTLPQDIHEAIKIVKREKPKQIFPRKWKMGPVPICAGFASPGLAFKGFSSDTLLRKLHEAIKIGKQEKLQRIVPRKEFEGKYFTKREKRLLEQLVSNFKTVKSDDIKESKHLLNSPWDKTIKEKGLNQTIDYFFALDNSPESLEYNDAANRVQERHEMNKTFGVRQ